MPTILVTRHIGSLFWTYQSDVPYDRVVDHLDPDTVEPGDVVIGTLPLHLAARVCERGARYLHLVIDRPPTRRDGELRRDELDRFDARLAEFRVIAGDAQPRRLRISHLHDARPTVVVAVATDQNVANLPPILKATRPGDEVIWLCSTPALRARASWASGVLEDLGLRSTTPSGDCPTRATEIPQWVDRHLRPLLGDRRVVFVGNGGLKPMSRAIEQSIDDLLDEVLYGEVPAPSIIRSPADRRLATRTQPCQRRIHLNHLLAFSGHAMLEGASNCMRLWVDGVRAPNAPSRTRFSDLEDVSRDYVRFLRMQRREKIDPDRINLADVRALADDGAIEVERRLAMWERSIDEALQGALEQVRSSVMIRELEADVPDMGRIESVFAALTKVANEVRQICGEARGLCAHIRRTGELDDRAAHALTDMQRQAVGLIARSIAKDARIRFKAQDGLFVCSNQMLREAELALQHPGDDEAVRALGPEFEAAVAARVLDRLDQRPPWAAAVGEVWSGVKVVNTARPNLVVAEYDVLLVLRNALMINIECKAGAVHRKDLDARVAVQGRAASSLAEMWLCSIMPTAKSSEDWFLAAHGVRQGALVDHMRHLPFTWNGQPERYVVGRTEYECPSFEDALDMHMSRFALADPVPAHVPA